MSTTVSAGQWNAPTRFFPRGDRSRSSRRSRHPPARPGSTAPAPRRLRACTSRPRTRRRRSSSPRRPRRASSPARAGARQRRSASAVVFADSPAGSKCAASMPWSSATRSSATARPREPRDEEQSARLPLRARRRRGPVPCRLRIRTAAASPRRAPGMHLDRGRGDVRFGDSRPRLFRRRLQVEREGVRLEGSSRLRGRKPRLPISITASGRRERTSSAERSSSSRKAGTRLRRTPR